MGDTPASLARSFSVGEVIRGPRGGMIALSVLVIAMLPQGCRYHKKTI
ncbi:hypothetical protein CNECB9_1100026 [Cupriavidus necator]|uniref:Uncharacterized protein n=1 Tax=Cupriavidus necator TaxID=106590 RepID=A0A1K0JDP9_CUPNE|nr:hypothetical protein CNECB9_1100026 [Cupriavidus necator]